MNILTALKKGCKEGVRAYKQECLVDKIFDEAPRSLPTIPIKGVIWNAGKMCVGISKYYMDKYGVRDNYLIKILDKRAKGLYHYTKAKTLLKPIRKYIKNGRVYNIHWIPIKDLKVV